MICFDSDDFGCNYVISDMCQSHDCRDQLDKFHIANPNFKATLFAIPGEMTQELINWCVGNKSWVELAIHGLYHSSNYECSEMTYEQFDNAFNAMSDNGFFRFFVKGFKAPGWQISDGVRMWLDNHGYWLADHIDNTDKRELIPSLKTYIIGDNSYHTHTWNCVGNGIYELESDILERIKNETDFRFASEMVV